MAKVKSLAELKAMREKLQSTLDLREKSNDPDSLVQIKVAMATCGIAAGAKQVMEHMMEKADELKLGIVFTQTGCMGYCHAEPTIEVKCPGKDPIVFGLPRRADHRGEVPRQGPDRLRSCRQQPR